MISLFEVDNFRSLKKVEMTLGPINFFCGPNGSGKTNLSEALDFLSHAFRGGLPYAVAEKGGFYNMAFRRQRRTRGGIRFRVRGAIRVDLEELASAAYDVELTIQTREEQIRSDYYVPIERYGIRFLDDGARTLFSVDLRRSADQYALGIDKAPDFLLNPDAYFSQEQVERYFTGLLKPEEKDLSAYRALRSIFPLGIFSSDLEDMKVFRISPRYASAAGTPSVSGELDKFGQNLPSALDFLANRHPRVFSELQDWIREVVPSLEYLRTDYTLTRQLGLFVQEKGFGSHWYADDLSDGTLNSIALFLAVLDPRHTCVFIEEPENSLHPWILRRFLECCREKCSTKQILITTQSPLVVAAAKPHELLLVERANGETGVTRAVDREPNIEKIIQKQFLDLGEYWLSGGLQAAPEPARVDESTLFDVGEKGGE